MNSLIIFCTVFLLFISNINCQKLKNNWEFSKFEDRLELLSGKFGYKTYKWPLNENEMSTWCIQWPKEKPAAKKFTLNCLTGMSKTMSGIIVYASEKINRLACKNKQERKKSIDSGKCGNKGKKETYKCWNEMTSLITNMKKLESKDKIPTLCCVFFWWRDCTIGAFRKIPASCTQDNIEYMEMIIDKSSIDPLNLLCSDYDESDRCDKITKNFDRTKVPSKYRTFFPALFDFFDTL